MRQWRNLPDDSTGDAAERRLTQAVIAPYDFDTPEVGEILQRDDSGALVIPVVLTSPARVNQVATRAGALFSVPLTSTTVAVKVLDADPRRAVLILAGQQTILVGRTKAEAEDANAMRIPGADFFGSPFGGPLACRYPGELWARVLGTAGRLSVCTETWAR